MKKNSSILIVGVGTEQFSRISGYVHGFDNTIICQDVGCVVDAFLALGDVERAVNMYPDLKRLCSLANITGKRWGAAVVNSETRHDWKGPRSWMYENLIFLALLKRKRVPFFVTRTLNEEYNRALKTLGFKVLDFEDDAEIAVRKVLRAATARR